MALHKNAAGRVFRRAHRGSLDLLGMEAKAFFDFAVWQCKETEALFKRLANAQCTEAAFKEFLLKLMPDPKKPVTADRNDAVRRAYETRVETVRAPRNEILNVHLKGIPARDIPPAEANWWGALNTITGWVDHIQKTDSDAYAHILLGSGDRLKTTALENIRKLA